MYRNHNNVREATQTAAPISLIMPSVRPGKRFALVQEIGKQLTPASDDRFPTKNARGSVLSHCATKSKASSIPRFPRVTLTYGWFTLVSRSKGSRPPGQTIRGCGFAHFLDCIICWKADSAIQSPERARDGLRFLDCRVGGEDLDPCYLPQYLVQAHVSIALPVDSAGWLRASNEAKRLEWLRATVQLLAGVLCADSHALMQRAGLRRSGEAGSAENSVPACRSTPRAMGTFTTL
jgi:hypothetical protein